MLFRGFSLGSHQGGGECGVDNLRTLCVLCHAEVTRVQTTERAAARRLEKEKKRRWVVVVWMATMSCRAEVLSCFFDLEAVVYRDYMALCVR